MKHIFLILSSLLVTVSCFGMSCYSEKEFTIKVTPVVKETYNENICQGEDYNKHGVEFKNVQEDIVYQWQVDCNEFTLNLHVCKPAEKHLYESICQGASYTKNNFNESTTGEYRQELKSKCGCDSIVVLHLDVIPSASRELFDKFCVNEPYNGRGFSDIKATKDTILTSKESVMGCPSVTHVNLTACYPKHTELEDVCQRGKPYKQHGYDFIAKNDTVAVQRLKTTEGCDSIVTLTLTVFFDYYFETVAAICPGDTYEWRKQEFKDEGTYTNKFKTIMGLDSIYCLKLSYNPTFIFDATYTLQNGDTYNWRGKKITTKGVYYDSLLTVNKCDSVFRITVDMCDPYYFHDEHTICDGEEYKWHDNTYAAQGTYYAKYKSIQGCDSIYTLVLNVNESPDFVINDTDEPVLKDESFYIQTIRIENVSGGLTPYLYKLDDNGFSETLSWEFINTMRGEHTFTVKDANQCATSKVYFYSGIKVPLIIPAYFTPDGDGENDTWVIKNLWFYPRSTVEIYDRYGKLLVKYNEEVNSWDGTYNGHQMPSDDYWYIVRIAETGQKISGHIILKR